MTRPVLMTSTAKRVLNHVSARCNVPVEIILHKSDRLPAAQRARTRAARIFTRLGYSSTDAGFALNRDHSTVLWWLDRHRKRLKQSRRMAA